MIAVHDASGQQELLGEFDSAPGSVLVIEPCLDPTPEDGFVIIARAEGFAPTLIPFTFTRSATSLIIQPNAGAILDLAAGERGGTAEVCRAVRLKHQRYPFESEFHLDRSGQATAYFLPPGPYEILIHGRGTDTHAETVLELGYNRVTIDQDARHDSE